MLDISLELALHSYQHTTHDPGSFQHDPVYEDMASKFFEHFVLIADAMNKMGACDGHQGLWDDKDGFYYDCLRLDGRSQPMRVRSMVGLIPLFACLVLEDEVIQKLPGFRKRLKWFLTYRPDLAKQVSQCVHVASCASYHHNCLSGCRFRILIRSMRTSFAICWPSLRDNDWRVFCTTCLMKKSSFPRTESVRCPRSTRRSHSVWMYVCMV